MSTRATPHILVLNPARIFEHEETTSGIWDALIKVICQHVIEPSMLVADKGGAHAGTTCNYDTLEDDTRHLTKNTRIQMKVNSSNRGSTYKI